MFPPDMIRALDYVANPAKQRAQDQTAASYTELCRVATLGGARLLGRTDLGRLTLGAKADITVIDLNSLRTGRVDDPIRTMVLNGNGASIKTVIVDGRTVVNDWVVPGIDTEATRRRAQTYFHAYKRAYSDWDQLRRPPEVLFPPAFRTIDRGTA
jgi:cytosine/adenosine deaminase-related metal-dependent hydrolase